MSEIAIRCEGLSKQYKIGKREKYKTLRDTLTDTFTAPFRRIGSAFSGANGHSGGYSDDAFWALDEVSFEVKQGEVVGVIGRNGAGKSTLLKILSRITEPTKGHAEIHGRVGSLLEVGTGFNPELSGRENIYLNGAILGMKKAEIERKFDEIVSFAEIGKFLDTPVKQYSTGMHMRLAFAVAAHLDPEILVVDEVLAVGDAAFQKKCLGKMSEVAGQEGRTVLFVSHNMAAIHALCTNVVVLDKGKLLECGDKEKSINRYQDLVTDLQLLPIAERKDRQGDGSLKIEKITVESADGHPRIHSTSPLRINLWYSSDEDWMYPHAVFAVYDWREIGIYGLDTNMRGGLPNRLPPQGILTCTTEPINLTAGQCYINALLYNHGTMCDYVQRAIQFDVEAQDLYGTGKVPERHWVIGLLPHSWDFRELADKASS